MRGLALIALLSTAGFAADSHEMLRAWLTRLANEQLADRSRKLATIQTAEQVRQRGKESVRSPPQRPVTQSVGWLVINREK